MVEIKRQNPKAFQELELKLKELAGFQSKVGFFESSKYEDGTPAAYVASLNELGHGPTPPRPFMRPTAVEKQQEWRDIATKGAKQVLAGKATAHDMMEVLGAKAEGDIVKTISEVFQPPLSPVTIELRAMKKRNPNLKVTAKTVGEAAARVRAPGYQPPTGVSTKPLNDSGYMVSQVTHITESV